MGYMHATEENYETCKERGIPGTGKKVGVVKGKKTVGKYMSQRSEYSEAIGQELLNSILEDAGFDS